MWRSPILKQDDAPTAPMGANHLQEALMSLGVPYFCDKQKYGSGQNIDHPVQDPLCAIAGDWHTDLPTASPVASIERRRLGYDDFVQYQDDRPRVLPGAMFKPPLAWRQ